MVRMQGWHRTLSVPRVALPHPRHGGTRGYALAMRQSEITSFQLDFPTVASRRSIYRWQNRLHPFTMNGNKGP